jgi:hypothetical protein
MKLPSFFKAKPEADPLAEALDLRERYGSDAEQWCESGILATNELERRRALYRVRELLRNVPADPLAYELRC